MDKQTKMLLGVGVVGVAAYLIWKNQQPKANQIGYECPFGMRWDSRLRRCVTSTIKTGPVLLNQTGGRRKPTLPTGTTGPTMPPQPSTDPVFANQTGGRRKYSPKKGDLIDCNGTYMTVQKDGVNPCPQGVRWW